MTRPVAYRKDLHTLVQEEAHGFSLDKILLQGGETDSVMRKAASTLAYFNQDDLIPAAQYSPVDQIAELRDVGEICSAVLPSIEKEVTGVIDAISSGLGDLQLMPTHRDLKLDHLFLDGEMITIIDFDSFAAADPVTDPATLLAQLVTMSHSISIPYGRINSAGRTFIEEYFTHVPMSWRSRLKLQYAGAALKGSVSFFRHQEPGWPEKMTAMVEEAKNALAGRIF